MDESFLKEHAARCRSLANKADEFTKRRLLDLASRYENRLRAKPRGPHALSSYRMIYRMRLQSLFGARNSATAMGAESEGEMTESIAAASPNREAILPSSWPASAAVYTWTPRQRKPLTIR